MKPNSNLLGGPQQKKPTTRKYKEHKENPHSGRVGMFENENLGDDYWDQYRGYIEKRRRFIPDSLAAEEQRSARFQSETCPDLQVLKAMADALGIENDIPWDNHTTDVGGADLPYISRHNPWLAQDPEVKRRAAQSLLSKISQAMKPLPEGGDGDGSGNSGKSGGQGQQQQPKAGRNRGKGQGQQQGRGTPSEGPVQARSGEQTKEEYKAPPKQQYYSGGGAQHYGDQKQESIFLSIRRLLSKLAEETDYSQVMETGRDRWDAKQLLTGYWNPTRIPAAKRDYATRVDHIFLSLDTSGSVDAYTAEIASMAAGAAGIVHLYSGTEGRPLMRVNRKEPLHSPGSPFPEWQNQESVHDGALAERWAKWWEKWYATWQPLYPTLEYGFEADVAWMLEVEKPKPGARLLFWGDTQGVGIYAPRLLAHLVRKYRFAWLYPYEPMSATNRWSLRYEEYAKATPEYVIKHPRKFIRVEYPKLQYVGLPVIFEVTEAVSIQRAMRELQTRK